MDNQRNISTIIINSPLFRDRNDAYDEDALPPIGLGLIVTSLRDNGIPVQLVDAVDGKIPLDELLGILDKQRPAFIGVNIFTTNYDLVKDLVESVSFTTHFVIGGLSTKELHKHILEWKVNNLVDVVMGDGELIMPDIVLDCLKESPMIQQGNFRVLKADGCSVYFVPDITKVKLDRSFFKNEPVKHPLGFLEANIVTSRGCIYNCSFCAAARNLNKEMPIREMNAAAISQELSLIQKHFPQVNSIRVLDDLFLKTNDCVEKAIEVFSKFPFAWRSMAHVMTFKNVDLGTLRRIKDSGCFELFIGIESGSPAILRSIKKTHNIELIVENLSKVMEAGINIKGYFIYGFPDETSEDMDMTYALAERLKNLANQHGTNFRTSVFQYRPYHATEIYYSLINKGIDVSVQSVLPNNELSSLVGRIQFNFHSGNYSKVDSDTVHDYIYRTNQLNGGNIFSRLSANGQTM